MSSTCFEPEGSSSGRRLYIQVWYNVFYMHQYKQSCKNKSVFDIEHTLWAGVEDIKKLKIKILI
jgi:hypothetical protein